MVDDTERSNFVKVDHIPTTILTADAVIKVEQLLICNPGDKPIKFNLKMVREQPLPIEVLYINEFIVQPYKAFYLMNEHQSVHTVFQNYGIIGEMVLQSGDSLVCFTSAHPQKCEIDIGYSTVDWKLKQIKGFLDNYKCEYI